MLYDMDKRAATTKLMELISFDAPFASILPNEYVYDDDRVEFVYSDLGVSAGVMRKLLDLTVRYQGVDRKFDRVSVQIERTGEIDTGEQEGEEIIHKHTVVIFK